MANLFDVFQITHNQILFFDHCITPILKSLYNSRQLLNKLPIFLKNQLLKYAKKLTNV